jgi:cytochrome c biogenesis protein
MNTVPATTAQLARSEQHSDVFDDLWQLFASPKLALVLMLGIAAAAMAGALLAQAPSGMANTPDAMRAWVNQVRPRYGVFTDLLQTLQFFSVFQSLWFRALLGLLAANTGICTVNRLPVIWHAVFRPTLRPADGLFDRGEPRQTVVLPAGSLDAVRPSLGAALTRLHHIVETHEPGGLYLYIDQNRFARFGTLVSHGALVMVLAAAVLSGPLGYFEENAFAVPIGSTRDLGHDTKLSLKVDDFVDEYYPEDGRPKDYRSEVVLFDAGREVARQTVRVNEPLVYNGVRFHQSAYGNAAALTISDASGRPLLQDSIPMTFRSSDGDRPVGYVYLPDRDLRVYVVGTGGAGDPRIQPGQVVLEAYQGSATTPTYTATLTQRQPQSLADLQVVFDRELQYTSLRVVRDPSSNLIWIASALMILGFVLAFYFPHRRLWARARRIDAGIELTLVGAGKDMLQPVARIAERLRRTHGR